MKKIVFATNNSHKIDEVRSMLSADFCILSAAEAGCHDDIDETAETLEGNAAIKAQYVWEKTGLDCFADDTGLEVDALNGAPGVRSARYAGDNHDFRANMLKLLENLEGETKRTARFRTVICLILSGKEYFFEGKIEGKIDTAERGNEGFGYDPIFIPEGYNVSFAQLGNAEKNRISHRAKAVEKLKDFLIHL
ncbi:MAG: non-canonical purine NTP diphosphatase [Paludibacter sp.]|nr:non-canonical purine NTP diphosphatase [Paludibacter sp.]